LAKFRHPVAAETVTLKSLLQKEQDPAKHLQLRGPSAVPCPTANSSPEVSSTEEETVENRRSRSGLLGFLWLESVPRQLEMTRISQGLPFYHLAMKIRPLVFIVHIPRMFSILLLAVSLNAQNESWDSPICTKSVLSVARGSHAVMTCNISNTFRDVTIELTANGKIRNIFNKKPPGNYSNESWQLQIQGGQAQLVITDAQGIHAGSYLWQLHGRQRNYTNITLNVSVQSVIITEPLKVSLTLIPPETSQSYRTTAAGIGVQSHNTQSDDMSPAEPSNKDEATDMRLSTSTSDKEALNLWASRS
ncbi:hypothetical protein A6R68_00480, partial [Neotoma lepida]